LLLISETTYFHLDECLCSLTNQLERIIIFKVSFDCIDYKSYFALAKLDVQLEVLVRKNHGLSVVGRLFIRLIFHLNLINFAVIHLC
jgi:hypothetical protein